MLMEYYAKFSRRPGKFANKLTIVLNTLCQRGLAWFTRAGQTQYSVLK